MTIQEFITDVRERFLSHKIGNAGQESIWLTAGILRLSDADLIQLGGRALDPSEIQILQSGLQRRLQGEPLAYILGLWSFHDYEFKVNPAVLIPRPETEELVEYALRGMASQGLLLDVGCGSGCIGLSLLAQKPGWQGELIDISPAALAVARHNQHQLRGLDTKRVRIYQSDIFESVIRNDFDLIVCNPPYIFPAERINMQREVYAYEPELALFHADPVQLYHRLVTGACLHLRAGGILLAELAPCLSAAVLAIAVEQMCAARIINDLSGKERFLLARSHTQ